jgi:hypothetical protein
MADIEARVNENLPIGFFTWCWTIVVEITDGRIGVDSGGSEQQRKRLAKSPLSTPGLMERYA